MTPAIAALPAGMSEGLGRIGVGKLVVGVTDDDELHAAGNTSAMTATNSPCGRLQRGDTATSYDAGGALERYVTNRPTHY